MGRKLTRSERKQIAEIAACHRDKDKKRLSAQDSIPFQRMWPDGICRTSDNTYAKTVKFNDINYQRATRITM